MSQIHNHMLIFQHVVQSNKPLTINDINDLVIPRLLDMAKDLLQGSSCDQVVLGRLKKFWVDIEYLKGYFDRLQILGKDAGSYIKELLKHIQLDAPVTFTDDSSYRELDEILTRLIRLTSSNCHKLSPGYELADQGPNDVSKKVMIHLPGMNPVFEIPSAFRHLSESYELLDPLHKACLLCFSAFPEDAEIKKRTIIHWWIGEELINPHAGDDGEETGHRILATLIEHGFVEDVIMKYRVTSSCRVHPCIRMVLVYLAKTVNFFDNLENREHVDGNNLRVCLTKGLKGRRSTSSSSSLQDLRRSPEMYLDQIETLFNVNKCYLDIKLHWFLKMKNIKALYLGRCDSKAIQHIEVKSVRFLTGLMYMKRLRLLSLQGVSKIVKLPESLGMLKNLRILDLRDCSDMEELPKSVKSLEKLTCLDLSGCYSLAFLPKEIASLSELQVLKGFLVQEHHQKTIDSCTWQDMTKLKKLRKLSIITTVRSFPAEEHLHVFKDMVELRKLTIAWRVHYRPKTSEHLPKLTHYNNKKPFLERLEKLDLQHIPYETAPPWLVSDKLQSLKKLYMKGGKFTRDLGRPNYPPWAVETLRLKYLPQLSMTWSEIQSLFPNLSYMEQVKCPMFDRPLGNYDVEAGVYIKFL